MSYFKSKDEYPPLPKFAVLTGLAIGDSLGIFAEKAKDEIDERLATWNGEYLPNDHHKLKAGEFSDDTSMAICIAKCFIELGTYSGDKVAANYLEWANSTPHGMGGTTRSAMQNLRIGNSYLTSGVELRITAQVGNGTAMRAAPIGACISSVNLPELLYTCRIDAEITHKHKEAIAGSTLVALATSYAVET